MENNEWISSAGMNSVRIYAAAAQLQNGSLFVTGGFNEEGQTNSAEMLAEEGWESKIPFLPATISEHCMVTVNSTTVMAIGGYLNSDYLEKTFYFTFGEGSWTEGPRLNYRRRYCSCGRIRRDKDSQEMSIIVAGGYDNSLSYILPAEILDEGSNEWRVGPELPYGIVYSQLVEDQSGGVILIGGYSSSVQKSLIDISKL